MPPSAVSSSRPPAGSGTGRQHQHQRLRAPGADFANYPIATFTDGSKARGEVEAAQSAVIVVSQSDSVQTGCHKKRSPLNCKQQQLLLGITAIEASVTDGHWRPQVTECYSTRVQSGAMNPQTRKYVNRRPEYQIHRRRTCSGAPGPVSFERAPSFNQCRASPSPAAEPHRPDQPARSRRSCSKYCS